VPLPGINDLAVVDWAISSVEQCRVRHKKHLDNLRWAAGFSIPELLMTSVYTQPIARSSRWLRSSETLNDADICLVSRVTQDEKDNRLTFDLSYVFDTISSVTNIASGPPAKKKFWQTRINFTRYDDSVL